MEGVVILNGGRSPESKDLRIHNVLSRRSVRRSFDSLRSLRMTMIVPPLFHYALSAN